MKEVSWAARIYLMWLTITTEAHLLPDACGETHRGISRRLRMLKSLTCDGVHYVSNQRSFFVDERMEGCT